jgi:hypothetical protein
MTLVEFDQRAIDKSATEVMCTHALYSCGIDSCHGTTYTGGCVDDATYCGGQSCLDLSCSDHHCTGNQCTGVQCTNL